ncbi:MAG: ABC transporter permease [Oscillospiraceae bacterium]|jgi:ribose/xylose/arabinose/galactoside ABC-type transport system permease subunit|nr:ABC transporter permease [Oscillospiraceae bacterium]
MEKKSGFRAFTGTKTFTLLLLLAFIVAIFAILTPGGGFLKPRNIKNMINGMSVNSILTIGAGCLLVSGQIDLSVGAVGTLSGVVFALLFTGYGVPVIPAVIISLAVVAVFGFINALLINRFHTQGFITTMATGLLAQGLGYILDGGKAIAIKSDAFNAVGTKSIFGGYLPISVIIAFAFFAVYGLLMGRTKFGRSIYLVGGNPTASYLSGIDPKRISYTLFLNSAILGGLAGLMYASRMKSATQSGITNSSFAGMTAAILGGISFGGGAGGMGGALLGLIILSAFNNGISGIGIPPYWQQVASGALLLVALSFDYLSLRRKELALRRDAARIHAAPGGATDGNPKA